MRHFHHLLTSEHRREHNAKNVHNVHEQREGSKEKCDDEDPEPSTTTTSSFSHRSQPLPSELLTNLERIGGDPSGKILALFKYITEKLHKVQENTPIGEREEGNATFRIVEEEHMTLLKRGQSASSSGILEKEEIEIRQNGPTQTPHFEHLPQEVQDVIASQRPTPQFLDKFLNQCFTLVEYELIPEHWYSLHLWVEKERVCVGWRWSYRPSSYLWPCWVQSTLCRSDVANPQRKLHDFADQLKEWMEHTLSTAKICDTKYPEIVGHNPQIIFDAYHTATVFKNVQTDGQFGALRCEWV